MLAGRSCQGTADMKEPPKVRERDRERRRERERAFVRASKREYV